MSKKKTLTVAFEVEALIHTEDESPRYMGIDLLRTLEALGCDILVWSRVSPKEAKEVCSKLDLGHLAINSTFPDDDTIDIGVYDNKNDSSVGKIAINISGDNDLTAMFDIHGTLIHGDDVDELGEEGESLEGTPRYVVIKLYQLLSDLNVDVGTWSADGKKVAKKYRKRLGLSGTSQEKDEKTRPEIAVDNNDDLGKVTLFV